MGKHKYFELGELIASETARRRKIDNTPTFQVVEHLDELVSVLLDPLRAAYGRPIHVSSGYRCPELNKAVGGAPSSVHQIGYAADLQVNGSFQEFCDFVVSWLKAIHPPFDQVLIEKNTKTGKRWLHIGLYNNAGQQRGIIGSLNVS